MRRRKRRRKHAYFMEGRDPRRPSPLFHQSSTRACSVSAYHLVYRSVPKKLLCSPFSYSNTVRSMNQVGDGWKKRACSLLPFVDFVDLRKILSPSSLPSSLKKPVAMIDRSNFSPLFSHQHQSFPIMHPEKNDKKGGRSLSSCCQESVLPTKSSIVRVLLIRYIFRSSAAIWR